MVRDIMGFLAGQNPEVGTAVQAEYDRQRRNIELIASRNFVSPVVLSAAAAVLTNKYAEGCPSKRYYGGCQCADVVENITCKRVCQLFGADHANAQPHYSAGTDYAVYAVLCRHGDTMLGMDLANGGHLTYGLPVNFSGKNYNIIAYGVSGQGYTDYDQVRDLTKEHGLRMFLADTSVYPRTTDFRTFADIAHEMGAYLSVDMAHIAGLVVVGLHPSPVPYVDVVTTTTHKTLRDPRGDTALYKEVLAKKIDSAIFPGSRGGPLGHIIATKAMALRETMKSEFKAYQGQILKNATALTKALMAEGFDLVNGDTDDHLILVDLRPARLTGKEMEGRLDEVNITVNKNAIPSNPEKPFVASGVRAGMPAATTHGFKEADMEAIVSIMQRTTTDSGGKQNELRAQMAQLTGEYPLHE